MRKRPRQTNCSYGIILINPTTSDVCLVQRKDSFGYLTCIVDNHVLASGQRDTAETLSTITTHEKEKLMTLSWDELWKDCGNINQNKQECEARFEWLGIRDAVKALDERGEEWCDTETSHWGLPKGRMSKTDEETGLRCAIRELKEETGIDRSWYDVISSSMYDEFVGTDGRVYKAEYYVCCAKPQLVIDDTLKCSKEIRHVAWKSLKDAEKLLKSSTYELVKNGIEVAANNK